MAIEMTFAGPFFGVKGTTQRGEILKDGRRIGYTITFDGSDAPVEVTESSDHGVVTVTSSNESRIAKFRAELEAAQREEREASERATLACVDAGGFEQYLSDICSAADDDSLAGMKQRAAGYGQDAYEYIIDVVIDRTKAAIERIRQQEEEAYDLRAKAKAASERAYAAKRELVKLGAWKEGE